MLVPVAEAGSTTRQAEHSERMKDNGYSFSGRVLQ